MQKVSIYIVFAQRRPSMVRPAEDAFVIKRMQKYNKWPINPQYNPCFIFSIG